MNTETWTPTIQGRFERFHAAHPEVYTLFIRFTLELTEAGASKIGAKMIMERIRWESFVKKTEKYKINNTFTSRYVRMFSKDYPQYASRFEIREVKRL